MKYPQLLREINKWLGAIAGILVLAIAVMACCESILRSVFHAPTKWTLDLSGYFLCVAIFLGSGYAYQEKGHVGVDMVRDWVEKKFGLLPRRVMVFIGYVICIAVIIIVMVAVWRLMMPALAMHQTTFANIPIPISILYGIMIGGSVMMVLTVIFILLDISKGNDFYMY
jgi:TRAP-type C4-dicarboxylate transport system permease small subunit